MKKFLIIMCLFMFYDSCEGRSATLELCSLDVLNENHQSVEAKRIKAGQNINLQMVYIQRGFSKKAKAVFKILVYDQRGEEILRDRAVHGMNEGENAELYRLQTPANASGPYLVVLTIKVFENKKAYARIKKKLPIFIEPSEVSSMENTGSEFLGLTL